MKYSSKMNRQILDLQCKHLHPLLFKLDQTEEIKIEKVLLNAYGEFESIFYVGEGLFILSLSKFEAKSKSRIATDLLKQLEKK